MVSAILNSTFGALSFDYLKAGPGEQASDLAITRGRLSNPRRVMIGLRFTF